MNIYELHMEILTAAVLFFIVAANDGTHQHHIERIIPTHITVFKLLLIIIGHPSERDYLKLKSKYAIFKLNKLAFVSELNNCAGELDAEKENVCVIFYICLSLLFQLPSASLKDSI